MLDKVNHLPLTVDDSRWLQRILSTCSFTRRDQLLDGYAAIFERKMNNKEHLEHQRDNKGRNAANKWIRAQVKGVADDIVKNCTTCEMMGDDGVCLQFREAPPESFKTTQKQECDLWLLEIPF